MSKRQEGNPLRERLADIARSATLTHREQVLVAGILLSLVLGAVVRHYRSEYRLHHPIAPPVTHQPNPVAASP